MQSKLSRCSLTYPDDSEQFRDGRSVADECNWASDICVVFGLRVDADVLEERCSHVIGGVAILPTCQFIKVVLMRVPVFKQDGHKSNAGFDQSCRQQKAGRSQRMIGSLGRFPALLGNPGNLFGDCHGHRPSRPAPLQAGPNGTYLAPQHGIVKDTDY